MKRNFWRLSLVAIVACSCFSFANAQDAATPPPTVKIEPQGDVKPQAESIPPSSTYQVITDQPMALNHPDVAYNYYMQPSWNGTAASMYPAPYPVPPRVGQVHYTYQPLMPHEHMYRHTRVYYTPHAPREMFYADPCKCKHRGQSYTKTTVIHTYGSNFLSPLPLSLPNFSLPIKKACGATCR